jgi:hypothetical protein
LTFEVAPGSHPLNTVSVSINDEAYQATNFTDVAGKRRYSIIIPAKFTEEVTIVVTVEDTLLYQGTASTTITVSSGITTPPTP